ncbi:hypothetical protein OH76DRAFT_1201315 [Lentinus brumalis]|uniref:Uncharacterized protein n=1 Tax=Lentinus brumalis TaxID=2498619 RepID=A0A371CT98_9APHY|nr:hypothetical protein OH76DRAFT_1201315 [Polyporus brumalis]
MTPSEDESTWRETPESGTQCDDHIPTARQAFRRFGRDKRHANGRKVAARGYLSAGFQAERKPFGRPRSETSKRYPSAAYISRISARPKRGYPCRAGQDSHPHSRFGASPCSGACFALIASYQPKPGDENSNEADVSKVQPVSPTLSQAPYPKARAEHEISVGEGGLIRTYPHSELGIATAFRLGSDAQETDGPGRANVAGELSPEDSSHWYTGDFVCNPGSTPKLRFVRTPQEI